MNPETWLFLAALFLLAAGGYGYRLIIHLPAREIDRALLRDARAERDTDVATAERERDVTIDAFTAKFGEQARAVVEVEQQLHRTEADLEWERLQHAVTEAERDMFATAFRGLLTNQVSAEVIDLDAPCGQSNVLEFPVRGGA
jgi:hypothetical protein